MGIFDLILVEFGGFRAKQEWNMGGKTGLKRRTTLSQQKCVMGGSFNSLRLARLNKLDNQVKLKLEGYLEKRADVGVAKKWKKR